MATARLVKRTKEKQSRTDDENENEEMHVSITDSDYQPFSRLGICTSLLDKIHCLPGSWLDTALERFRVADRRFRLGHSKMHTSKTYLTNPLVNAAGGVISCPRPSRALDTERVATTPAMANHRFSSPKCLPGQPLYNNKQTQAINQNVPLILNHHSLTFARIRTPYHAGR
jgi:hypothetical protein